MCGEGIYEHDEMMDTIEELGGITVSDSPMHCMVYVYNAKDEVLFTVTYEDIDSMGGDTTMDNTDMEKWILKNFTQEVVDMLVEKEYA